MWIIAHWLPYKKANEIIALTLMLAQPGRRSELASVSLRLPHRLTTQESGLRSSPSPSPSPC